MFQYNIKFFAVLRLSTRLTHRQLQRLLNYTRTPSLTGTEANNNLSDCNQCENNSISNEDSIKCKECTADKDVNVEHTQC